MLFEKIKINKKRLIRKAEFVDGFQHRDAETGMVSLYKNPTDSEISEAKAESMFKAIRGVILENGEIYCWSGDILHDDMSSKAKISMDGNVFRFACENNRWIFDLHDDIPFEIGFELCNNHKSTLERFGNINKSLQFFFGYDSGNQFENLENVMSARATCVTFSGIDQLNNFLNNLQ